MTDIPADPLGVLVTTAAVMEQARVVTIDAAQIAATADALVAQQTAPSRLSVAAWGDDLHYRDLTEPWRTVGWVLVLDALNFCFWSQGDDPDRRWRVAFRDQVYDGYWALAAALRRAVEEGYPLWDAAFLAGVSEEDVAAILRPAEMAGSTVIPLLPARVANLRELGRGLLDHFSDGDLPPPAALLRASNNSAVRLVELVAATFPSFNDVATYDGRDVRFFKRAQILVADLHGALTRPADGAPAAPVAREGAGRDGVPEFLGWSPADLGALTAFADYKVPQVLRRFGILRYAPDLADRIWRRVLLPAGSPEEVEIRAVTIWACELLRRALAERGQTMHAFEVDWALWTLGQALPPGTEPYHRTVTMYY